MTAPDLFPACDQRELTEWMSSTAVPSAVRKNLFDTAPATLCDQRQAANLQSFPGTFDHGERTVTAIVGLFGQVSGARTEAPPGDTLRHSHLPDDAAGVFDPRRDVAYDALPDTLQPHMAAYGLGSPFPEDVKLCAALSDYWPGVTPDTTRTYPRPGSGSTRAVAPLTDEEIGQVGDLARDGVPGPRVIQVGEEVWADFPGFDQVDYVANALDRRFSLRLTARVDSPWRTLIVTMRAKTISVTGYFKAAWRFRVAHGRVSRRDRFETGVFELPGARRKPVDFVRESSPPSGEPVQEGTEPVSALVCEERLGGLLRYYTRQAA